MCVRWLLACIALLSSLTAAVPAWADPQPVFLYYLTNPDSGANSIAAFRVNETGNLSPIFGSPFSTGGSGLASVEGSDYAHRIVVSRARNRLFAVNEKEGSIAVFKVSPASGTLTAVPGSPFVVGDWANNPGASLAISNDGLTLYGASLSVVSYSVDAATGALSSIGAHWTFPFRINGIALTDANDTLYLTMSDHLTMLKAGSTGLLGPGEGGFLGTLSLGNGPTDVAISHAGDLLYVGSQGGIDAFRVAAGSFTPVSGTPFFSGSANLSGLTLDFAQQFLVAYGVKGPALDATLVNANGALTQGQNSPMPPGIPLSGAVLSPDGQRLFTSNSQSQLDAWNVDATGGLTHVAGYPVTLAVPAGFSKLAAIASPPPGPVPALPPAALAVLVLAILRAGPNRKRQRTSCSSQFSGN
jgi:hypothetical protein